METLALTHWQGVRSLSQMGSAAPATWKSDTRRPMRQICESKRTDRLFLVK